MRIPVVDVHELRAAPVGARRQGASELLLAEAGPDVEDLAALDVGAKVDDQIGVALDSLLHEQAMLTGPRMGPRANTAGNRALPRVAGARRGHATRLSWGRRGVRPLARAAADDRRGGRRSRPDGIRHRPRSRAAQEARAGDDRAQERGGA